MDGMTLGGTNERTCEVCGRSGDDARVCRFEVGCTCWYGKPCDGLTRRTRAAFRRIARERAAAVTAPDLGGRR